MIEARALIVNSRGLHARPSARLARLAASYKSAITIFKGKQKADAKSVAALLMLAAAAGTELKITADGADEKQALAALLELIAEGFSDDSVPNNPMRQDDTDDAPRAQKKIARKISGIGVGDAVVSGKAHIYSDGAAEVPRYHIGKTQLPRELARYDRAAQQVREEFEALLEQTAQLPGGAAIKPFIDLYLMLLADKEFARKPQALMRRRLINAEWALKERVEAMGDNFRRLPNDYLRERYHDVEQVQRHLLAAMSRKRGGSHRSRSHSRDEVAAGENALLVAEDMSPADVIRLNHQGYKGFIIEHGGANSHTAILARSMDIPAVVGARGVLSCVKRGDTVLLDAAGQVVVIHPGAEDLQKAKRKTKRKAPRRVKGDGKGALSADGARVYLNANIEFPDETDAAARRGADGIGLFRTEFLFMERPDLPSEDEQFELYRSALASVYPLPVVIRTLDIGGDKMPASAGDMPVGGNPALGVRAIRYCLQLPDVFMTQLRALLRASAARDNLRILLPMIAHAQELERVTKMLAAAKEQLRVTAGVNIKTPPLGVMIEVPAAAFIMKNLAPRLDFFSIGTNDLIQYIMAADRNNETLEHLCDPLHPAVPQMLALIVKNAARCGLPVTLCGEMAGDADLMPLVLGLGLRQLSMAPARLDEARERVQQLNCGDAAKIAARVLRAPTADAAREIIGRQQT